MRSEKSLLVFSLVIGAVSGSSACSKAQQSVQQPSGASAVTPEERQLYLDAAHTSWNFVNRITEPSTGLARAHATYSYVTLWDIAGVIAANYTAHELAFINDATYDSHIRRILATLSTIDLFDNAAFNRIYDAKTGRMVDNASKISNLGAGWSSVDIGRLLIWLRILSVKQPKYAPLATQIVRRLNMSKLLNDGYLQGVDVDPEDREETDLYRRRDRVPAVRALRFCDVGSAGQFRGTRCAVERRRRQRTRRPTAGHQSGKR